MIHLLFLVQCPLNMLWISSLFNQAATKFRQGLLKVESIITSMITIIVRISKADSIVLYFRESENHCYLCFKNYFSYLLAPNLFKLILRLTKSILVHFEVLSDLFIMRLNQFKFFSNCFLSWKYFFNFHLTLV